MTKLIIKNCKDCGNTFMGKTDEVICKSCKGESDNIKISGAPNLGRVERLGDNKFPKGSKEWNDLLKKIKKENPGSNIEIK